MSWALKSEFVKQMLVNLDDTKENTGNILPVPLAVNVEWYSRVLKRDLHTLRVDTKHSLGKVPIEP
jgi:hypothetical protein